MCIKLLVNKINSLQSENQYLKQELNAVTRQLLEYMKTPNTHKNSDD